MVKPIFLRAIFAGCTLGVAAAVSGAGPPPAGLSGMQAQIDTHFESDGIFRNRISASTESSIGSLSVFVEEDCQAAKLTAPVIGLATPPFDLGPLREGGLIRELNHPFGLGSIREHSRVVLDRSVGATVSPGGVVRIGSRASGRPEVEFYAFRRAGTAFSETNTGGITCRTPLVGGLDIDLATKITSFGLQRAPEEWLTERPAVPLPAVVKGGVRLSGRFREFRANLSSGVAFSDRIRPAGFCSGFLGFSKSLRVAVDQVPKSSALSLSGRLEGGAADPNYYGDDGRFVLKTALLHPVFSLRLPGLRAAGSYQYTIYRLPLLPALYRRTVHGGELTLLVGFGPLSIEGSWQPHLEYTERGRTLFREVTGLSAELFLGALSVRGEIGFRHSNEWSDEIEAGFSLTGQGRGAIAGCSVKLRDGCWSAGVDVTTPRGPGSLQIGAAIFDLASVVPPRGISEPSRPWVEAVSRSELTVSWRARSR